MFAGQFAIAYLARVVNGGRAAHPKMSGPLPLTMVDVPRPTTATEAKPFVRQYIGMLTTDRHTCGPRVILSTRDSHTDPITTSAPSLTL